MVVLSVLYKSHRDGMDPKNNGSDGLCVLIAIKVM